jgi:hypothetical protein
MQKLILSYFLSVISVAIASTIPILAIEAQPVDLCLISYQIP